MRRPGISERRGSASSAAAVAVAIALGAVALGYGLVANSTAGSQVSTLSATLRSEAGQLSSFNATLVSMSDSLSGQASRISAMNATSNSQAGEIAGLESTVGSLQASIASLQTKLTSVTGLLSSTESADSVSIDQLQSEVASLNATQAADSAAIIALQTEIQGLNSEIQTLESEISTPPASSGPGLVQEAGATCSFPCAEQFANASFTFAAHEGDILVVTLVADDVAPLTLSDSLGTNLSLATRATSTTCDSNSGACQAEIYWGTLPASGPESVTVNENDLGVALRVQAWEFSGVTSLGNTASCSPTCASVSYPSGSILVATARDASGSGQGFSWYPYALSGVAGSEYELATSSGSTAFPFSTAVNDVEAAVVLV